MFKEIQKMQNLGNDKIMESSNVKSWTDAQKTFHYDLSRLKLICNPKVKLQSSYNKQCLNQF